MILIKTDAGQQVLKDRSVRMTPRQRSAFILFDGKRSVDQVLAAGMGIEREDVEQLIALGLLAASGGPVDGQLADDSSAAIPAGGAPTRTPIGNAATAPQTTPMRSPQQRYQDAYPVATRLTAGLGLRGFRLNLAVEGTSTYEELVSLAPKIRAAVGSEKAAALDQALGI